MTASQSSRFMRSISWSRVMPALLTRMSIRPMPLEHAGDGGVDRRGVGHVERDGLGLSAGGPNLRRRSPAAWSPRAAATTAAPRAASASGDGPADSARRSRDQGHTARPTRHTNLPTSAHARQMAQLDVPPSSPTGCRIGAPRRSCLHSTLPGQHQTTRRCQSQPRRPQSLLAHIAATVWMTDERMVLTFVSGELIRRLQVDPATLIGRTLPDLLLDGREDHPIIQGHVTALAGHETAVRIEWGGNLYNARIAPLRDASGRIVGCVGVQQMIGWLPDDDACCARATSGCGASSTKTGRHRLRRRRGPYHRRQRRVPALVRLHARRPRGRFRLVARPDAGRDPPAPAAGPGRDPDNRPLHAVRERDRSPGRPPRSPLSLSAARLSARRREGVAFVLDISDRTAHRETTASGTGLRRRAGRRLVARPRR